MGNSNLDKVETFEFKGVKYDGEPFNGRYVMRTFGLKGFAITFQLLDTATGNLYFGKQGEPELKLIE